LQHVAEYAEEIFQLLLKEEPKYLPSPTYMERQRDINAKMRAILMDWLVEVHMKYKLRMETLHLTVTTIDRYLTRMPVLRKRLQLVGVVAMFIAAKFEEINPPGVGDYEYITDNAYTKQDILLMECQMLNTLDFHVVTPTVAHFMEPLQRMNSCDDAQKEFVQYLCELALLEIKMVGYTPSRLVSAAILLSNEMQGRRVAWPSALQETTRHTEEDLRPCVEELRNLLEQAPAHWLQAVQKKYQSSQHKVARGWP
jgi:cyclin B